MSTVETPERVERVEDVELLTVAEVAKVLRVSRATSYRLVNDGRVPSCRVGGQIRVHRRDLLAVLQTGIRIEED